MRIASRIAERLGVIREVELLYTIDKEVLALKNNAMRIPLCEEDAVATGVRPILYHSPIYPRYDE
jgi:hypothetical protein